MVRKLKYRLLKGAWGIAIDITAEAIPLSLANKSHAIKVTVGVWLEVKEKALTKDELNYLQLGLRLVANRLQLKNKEPILVRVLEIWTNYVDYQPEGLACAIALWAAEEFHFTAPTIPVVFEQKENRYSFSFNTLLAESK